MSMRDRLLLAWQTLTNRWRCRCCGEFYGKQCEYWCAQEGCTHGRI